MKQINVKLLTILFLTTLFVLVGAVVLYKIQLARNATGLLTRADAKEQEGDYGEAAKYIARYLRLKPDDNEKYLQLATTYKRHLYELIEKNEFNPEIARRTFASLEEAVRKNPDHREIRESAVEFSMRMGRAADAVSHLTFLLEGPAKGEPELQVLLARCYTMSGQDEKAIEPLCALVGYDRTERQFTDASTAGDNVEAYQLLATILTTRQRDEQAGRAVIDRMVEVNPENHQARLMRAQYLMMFARDAKALVRDDLDRALELAPEDATALLAVADFARQEGELDRAKELYERFMAKYPTNTSGHRGLAQWALSSGDRPAAISWINQGLEIEPANAGLYWMRANIELDSGELDAVGQTRAKLEELKFPRWNIDLLDGRIDLANKQWVAATNKLEEARSQVAQYRPEWLPIVDAGLAQGYKEAGRVDQWLKAVERIVDARPDDVNFRFQRIEALLASGQSDRAAEAYRDAKRFLAPIDSSTPEQQLVFRLQMELLQPAQRTGGAVNPEATQLVNALWERGAVTNTSTARVVKSYYESLGAAGLEEFDRRFAAARRAAPRDLSFLLEEVRQIANRDGIDAALQRLEAASGPLGDPLTVRLLRCELLARVRPEEALQKMRILEGDLPALSPDRQRAGLEALRRIYTLLGDQENTERLWEQLATAYPQDVPIRLGMFESAMQSGDAAKIQTAMDNLEKLVGRDSAEWKWASAFRQVDDFKRDTSQAELLARSAGLLQEAIGQRDSWEALYRLQGEIYLLRNESSAAVESFETALDLGASNPGLFRILAKIYFTSGQNDKAADMLQRLPQPYWTKTEQQINLQLLASDGNLPEELPYDPDSKDPDEHLIVAKLLTNARRFDRAKEAFDRAVALAPQNIDAWTSLVQWHVASGKMDQVDGVLEQARETLSEEMLPYFLSNAAILRRDWQTATDELQKALAAKPGDPAVLRSLADVAVRAQDNESAQKWLDQMLQDAPPYDPAAGPNIRWARRTKAMLLANTGSYHDFTEALRIIDENAPRDGFLAPDDSLLWAQLSAQRPDGLSRDRAIEKLERARDERRLTDAERRVLAELYERQERWTECKSEMLDLLAKRPNDLQLLDPWLKWLIKHDEEQQAAKWMDNCPPNSVVRIRTQAHLDVRRGNPQQAAERLINLLPQELTPADGPTLRVVADILEELGQYDSRMYAPAEKVYRRFAELQPEDTLALAAFLGRREELEKNREALAMCAAALEQEKYETALQLAVSILRRNRQLAPARDSETAVLVRGWFDKAQQARPESLAFLIQRAEFEDVVGDHDAAEQWMRAYMAHASATDKQKAIVANNLAYLLALKGEKEESLELIQSAMRELGPTADLRDTLGVVYLARGEVLNAIREFESSIGDGGPSSFKHIHLALARMKDGDPEGAAENVKRAMEMGLETFQMSQLEVNDYEAMVDQLKAAGLLTEEDLKDSGALFRKT